VDSAVIAIPPSIKTVKKTRPGCQPDKEGNTWYFGYKAYKEDRKICYKLIASPRRAKTIPCVHRGRSNSESAKNYPFAPRRSMFSLLSKDFSAIERRNIKADEKSGKLYMMFTLAKRMSRRAERIFAFRPFRRRTCLRSPAVHAAPAVSLSDNARQLPRAPVLRLFYPGRSGKTAYIRMLSQPHIREIRYFRGVSFFPPLSEKFRKYSQSNCFHPLCETETGTLYGFAAYVSVNVGCGAPRSNSNSCLNY